MDSKDTLTGEYIVELFHVAFSNENFFLVCAEHLQYNFLTHDYEKKFWKKCMQLYHLNGTPPSLGVVQVELRKDEKVKDLIVSIKNIDEVSHDEVIESFQDFVKESKFVEVFEKAGDLWNRGEEKQAYKIYLEGAEKMANFTIKEKMYKKVFGDFQHRNNLRLIADFTEDKVPFGIDQLDEYCSGGPQLGDTYLAMSESGIGKSQFLYHHAINTARNGADVALYQIEGTERQVMDRLDSAWSGVLYHEMKYGKVEDDRYKKLKRVVNSVRGEIYVEAFEKFGGVTFAEIRRSARDLKRLNPNLKLILIDYLELMEVGDGINYGPKDERHRQQKLGKLMKELAMELNVVVGSVTQASTLSAELKKDPEFVMTREYLSEDKGKIRPFDMFFTFNQTFDERKMKDEITGKKYSIIRIYLDKFREYDSGQVVKIVTNFARARFYDRRRTLELIVDYEDEE